LLWNLYLFSFATFLDMDTAVFQLNLQQGHNYPAGLKKLRR
jgi:hypothetical protein